MTSCPARPGHLRASTTINPRRRRRRRPGGRTWSRSPTHPGREAAPRSTHRPATPSTTSSRAPAASAASTTSSPARGTPTSWTTRAACPGPRGGGAKDGISGSGTRSTSAAAKARVSFRLPADLVERARDAVAHLAGSADETTLTALTERALRTELARLAAAHNRRRPFPPRPR
jgi:hypothetical protein